MELDRVKLEVDRVKMEIADYENKGFERVSFLTLIREVAE